MSNGPDRFIKHVPEELQDQVPLSLLLSPEVPGDYSEHPMAFLLAVEAPSPKEVPRNAIANSSVSTIRKGPGESPPILLVYGRRERNGNSLEEVLDRHGYPFAVMVLETVLTGESPVEFRSDTQGHWLLIYDDARSGRRCHSGNLKGIWAQDMGIPQTSSGTTGGNSFTALSDSGRMERRQFAFSILAALDHRFLFLPELTGRMRARSPYYLSNLARCAGLKVPSTSSGLLASFRAREFWQDRRLPIHYQPLSTTSITRKGKTFMTVSRFIEREKLFALANLRAPALFSQWPIAFRRYLAALVRGEWFVVEVAFKDLSLAPHVTDLDYHHALGNLICSPSFLPNEIQTACGRVMSQAGLSFGVVDLLHSQDRYANWFFVSARPGAGLDLFEEAGIPAWERLARWLCSGRTE
jgi:hypothetical protein